MKSYIISTCLLLTSTIYAEDNLLLSDDFSDNSLNSSTWTHIATTGRNTGFDDSYGGSSVVESNGVLSIYQSATDSGGGVRTQIDADCQGVITISRNLLVHSANTYTTQYERLIANGSVLLNWGYYNYSYGGNSYYGFGNIYGDKVSAIWDQYFTEVITYNPLTGAGTLRVNGGTPVSIEGTAMGNTLDPIEYYIGAYGWYTGHYKNISSITIEQENLSGAVDGCRLPGVVYHGDNSYTLDWFGSFQGDRYPVITHQFHGELYLHPNSSAEHLYFYSMIDGWIYTSPTIYPYLYSYNAQTWLYYYDGTDAPRWFWNFNTASYMNDNVPLGGE